MRRPKDVCPKECPTRNSKCHSKCKTYLNYYNGCREHREKKQKTQVVDEYTRDSITKSIRRTR